MSNTTQQQQAVVGQITDEDLALSAVLVVAASWADNLNDGDDGGHGMDEFAALVADRCAAGGYLAPIVVVVDDPTDDIVAQIESPEQAEEVIGHLKARFGL